MISGLFEIHIFNIAFKNNVIQTFHPHYPIKELSPKCGFKIFKQ